MSSKVTPRQIKAIETLAITGSVTKAAAAAGVSRKTVYKWLRLPAFSAELEDTTRQARDSFSRALVGLGEKAIAAFDDALDPAKDINTRRRAATSVKSGILQLAEIDVENRLAKLEEKLYENDNP